jgi:hypothetical protein
MEYYEIIVDSYLDNKRARDFPGLTLRHLDSGNTLLYGELSDRAALYSVLSKIRDMNLTLVSVRKNDERTGEKPVN